MKRLIALFILCLAACTPSPQLGETAQSEPSDPSSTEAIATAPCSGDGLNIQINHLANMFSGTRRVSSSDLDTLIEEAEHIATDCYAEAFVQADTLALIEQIQAGGYVLYVRHTETDRAQDDTDLTTCDGQRNLNEAGREQAIVMRHGVRAQEIPISELITTEYCRTQETTILAFAMPDDIIPRSQLADDIEDWFSTPPVDNTNRVIVAHIGTIQGTIGLPDTFNEGDILIYEPLGDGEYIYTGRIPVGAWRGLTN